MPPTAKLQTREDREHILANLPEGTHRVQITTQKGDQQYKRPEDVDLDHDEISLAKDGSPVVMRGKPGRKLKVQLNPVTPHIAQISFAREDHIENSNLLKEARRDSLNSGVVDSVIVGMSEEASALEFDRLEAQRNGQDGSGLSMKRARVLKAIGDLVLKSQMVSEGAVVDMDSPQFLALFTYICETFKDAMKSGGCRSEQIEQSFTYLVTSIKEDSWKQEAKARMKSATP